MSMIRLLLFIPFLGLFISWSYGQTLSCSELSVVAYVPDSANPNVYQFTIQTQGTQSDFINYPFISSVLDCNGNLVGSGNLFWFGQFGQTVQQYPINLTGPGSIDCYPLSVSFVYQDNMGVADTCQLLLSSNTASNATDESVVVPLIFPNPTSGKFTLRLGDNLESSGFTLLDLSGKKVLSGKLNAPDTTIDVTDFSPGTYLIVLDALPNHPFIVRIY